MTQSPRPCGLLRRLAAMIYDSLLLLALWMMGTGFVLYLNSGEPIDSTDWRFRAFLLTIAMIFLCGFWWWAGRTLGMQAWRLRLVRIADDGPVTLNQSLLRFFAALLSLLPLGLGFLWSIADRDRLAWHDRLSGTRLVALPPDT